MPNDNAHGYQDRPSAQIGARAALGQTMQEGTGFLTVRGEDGRWRFFIPPAAWLAAYHPAPAPHEAPATLTEIHALADLMESDWTNRSVELSAKRRRLIAAALRAYVPANQEPTK